MSDGGQQEFSPLCPACATICYNSKPLWRWDEDSLHTIMGLGRLQRLHSQIRLFYRRFQEQAPSQTRRRKSAVSPFRRLAQSLWPSCQVHMYGSSATGLFLPSSDIDLVIFHTGCSDTVSALETFAELLLSAFRGRLSQFELLRNARVPIVRFFDEESLFRFDVRIECNFRSPPELRAVQLVKDSLVQLPAMGPLYILLKTFLHENRLDTLYQDGGVRPYMLFSMLYVFLYLVQSFCMEGSPDDDYFFNLYGCVDDSPNLALLLLGFLHFFGSCFKSEKFGISSRKLDHGALGRCCFFAKRKTTHKCGICPIKEKAEFYYSSYPQLLAVEDPLNPSNDLGKNSHNYPAVKDAFMSACLKLIAPTSELLHSFIPISIAGDSGVYSR